MGCLIKGGGGSVLFRDMWQWLRGSVDRNCHIPLESAAQRGHNELKMSGIGQLLM
jgi:hypothetical protein